MMRVLLVDDEKPARDRLRRLLEGSAEIEIVGEAENGLIALERIESLKPDVVFLDIEMPELDGFSVARSLPSDGPALVFATAYDEFALKAFETHAVDYLLKPVSDSRLKLCLDKVHARKKTRNVSALLDERMKAEPPTRLAIKSGHRYIVVQLDRVSAILAQDHYSAFQIDGRELLADETLDAYEKKLDPSKFLRVHRSAIVNLDFVRELEREGDRKFNAILTDPAKTRVAIARERLDEVKLRLGLSKL